MSYRKSSVASHVILFVFFLTFSPLRASAQSANASSRITEAIDEKNLVSLPGNVHPLARREFDQGAAPPDLPMDRILLVLKRGPEQDAALIRLLDNQQDKSSPNYHNWLTPDQFGQQFGLAESDTQTVTSWLESHGFKVTQVSKGRTVIEFSGTAAQVQEAFHTSIHKYVVNREEHWANAIDPQIPSALAPAVAGLFTLHNFVKKPQIQVVENSIQAQVIPGMPGKPPQVTFPGTPPQHAVAPLDFATIYNFDPTYQPQGGRLGPRIAVMARSNFNTGDVDGFSGYLPLNGLNREQSPYVILNGPDPGNLGGLEEAEVVLDASWSGGLVVNNFAEVLVVVSATTNTTDGVDLSEVYIIDNNFGDIVTESFGDCEANFTSAQAAGVASLAQQAAAQGITYIVSTGDSGAEGCEDPHVETSATGPISVNLLASTPYTVAVGGTKFNENGQDSKYWNSSNAQYTLGSAVSYIPEDVWNDSCTAAQCGQTNNIFAGGGGHSTFFSKPSWQTGVAGIPSDGARDIPDVSFSASSHDPYLICLHSSCVPDSQGYISFAAVYGTSVAAPSFAGIMALVDLTTNSRQGQADYVLYKLAAESNFSQCNGSNTFGLPASTCTFNDVTIGNNAVPGESGFGSGSAQYQSGVGYDLATGLGSLNIMNLLKAFGSTTFNATSTSILRINPTTITHGQPVQIDVQVTSNSGTPSGSVSLLSSSGYNGTSVGAFPLTAGSFSSTVSSLLGGTYTLTALYGGDGTFAPSTSSPSPSITVIPEPSTTTLSVLGFPGQNSPFPIFTSGPYGSFVYLRADVAGQSQNGIPTGSVVFSDTAGSVPGNPFVLNSGGNTATRNGVFVFPPGTHNISATYSGDSSFNSSTSLIQSFMITPAATTTTVAGSAAPQGVTFTATVNTTSGGNPPSGTILFTVNGVSTAIPLTGTPAVINPQTDAIQTWAQATTTFTASNISNGQSYAVNAAYNGDGNYLASSGTTSGTGRADFSVSTAPSSLTLVAGQSAPMTISITALDGYTGTVNFSSSSCAGLPAESSCSFSPSSVSGGGNTTLTIATTAPHQIASLHLRRDFGAWSASVAVISIGAVLLGVPFRRRAWSRLLVLIAFAIGAACIGCGSGSGSGSTVAPPQSDPGTPFGTYTITVTANSGNTTHTTVLTLNVD